MSKKLKSSTSWLTNFILSICGHHHMFKFLIVCFVTLSVFMVMKICYLFIDTSLYLSDDLSKIPESEFYLHGKNWDRFIRELDIAGLAGGLVGIIFSLYITSIVEKANDLKEDEELQREEERNEQLKKIEDVIKSIYEKEKNFRAIDNILEIEQSISDIFDFCLKGKQLFVMNHSASFGYLLGFRLQSIIDYHNIDIPVLKNMQAWDFYQKYEKYGVDRIQKIQSKQSEVGSFLNSVGLNAIYVTLDPYKNSDGIIPYREFYLKEIINSKTVIIIFYNIHEKKNIQDILNITSDKMSDFDNIYLVPLIADIFTDEEIKENNPAKLKEFFIEHLIKKQETDIRTLESSGFIVQKANKIYFQVYLNKIEPNQEQEGACLFMFVNQQTLANSGIKLVAFETRKEKYVTDSFINIINTTQ